MLAICGTKPGALLTLAFLAGVGLALRHWLGDAPPVRFSAAIAALGIGIFLLIFLVTHPSLAIALLINFFASSRRSNWSNGGGWSGGGLSGGFGGGFSGGGGRSGGGGASGSW